MLRVRRARCNQASSHRHGSSIRSRAFTVSLILQFQVVWTYVDLLKFLSREYQSLRSTYVHCSPGFLDDIFCHRRGKSTKSAVTVFTMFSAIAKALVVSLAVLMQNQYAEGELVLAKPHSAESQCNKGMICQEDWQCDPKSSPKGQPAPGNGCVCDSGLCSARALTQF